MAEAPGDAKPAKLPNKIPSYSLDTLAKRWENCDTVRRNVLFHGSMLQWKSAETTGIASNAASSLNFEVCKEFFEVWTSVCPKKRTPLLPHVQIQVPLLAIIEYRVHVHTFEGQSHQLPTGAPALQGLEPAGH